MIDKIKQGSILYLYDYENLDKAPRTIYIDNVYISNKYGKFDTIVDYTIDSYESELCSGSAYTLLYLMNKCLLTTRPQLTEIEKEYLKTKR